MLYIEYEMLIIVTLTFGFKIVGLKVHEMLIITFWIISQNSLLILTIVGPSLFCYVTSCVTCTHLLLLFCRSRKPTCSSLLPNVYSSTKQDKFLHSISPLFQR
ncbi:hypothetical protein L2E82_02423 [Cichorium intybus]|uniref:Uncharacterized protein n=1 Tax=Cichorium intybus TaxID=13427 RepID=A0ACB9H1A5_CICIN|nr:hypothetical protein L2E82_02423 [Cichorium intybus]